MPSPDPRSIVRRANVAGMLLAKPPQSPHANLTAVERVGTSKSGSAVWKVVCTCGANLTADAPSIKRGGKRGARCKVCNLTPVEADEAKLLGLMPAGYAVLARKMRLTVPTIEYRLELLRAREKCYIGGWERADAQGAFGPVFHAGKGEDMPCTLKPRSPQAIERRYRKRVKRAIAKAEQGGKVDDRYARHVLRRLADATAEKTRTAPQGIFAALGL